MTENLNNFLELVKDKDFSATKADVLANGYDYYNDLEDLLLQTVNEEFIDRTGATIDDSALQGGVGMCRCRVPDSNIYYQYDMYDYYDAVVGAFEDSTNWEEFYSEVCGFYNGLQPQEYDGDEDDEDDLEYDYDDEEEYDDDFTEEDAEEV